MKKRLLLSLSFAGIMISGYLLWHRIAGRDVACIRGLDCDLVLNSAYSSVKEIPVALFGLAGYVSIFIAAILQFRSHEGYGTNLRLLIFGISLTGFLFSLYLTLVEIFILSAICLWCITSMIVISIIFIVALYDVSTGDMSHSSHNPGIDREEKT